MADEQLKFFQRWRSEEGIVAQMLILYRAFIASPQRNGLIALAIGLAIVIGLTAFGQARLNRWNEPFYDALARKDMGAFFAQLGVFLVIAGGLLLLNVVQAYVNLRIKLRLREGLTKHLIEQWLMPRRAFRLAHAGEIGVNPDQRIHEDARHLSELSTDLSMGLLQATLLLLTFVGILWGLSDGVVFRLRDHSFSIPGYMVWAALLYAVIGSWLSWRVGRPLIGYNAERYAREADLRFALVRANERPDSIALYGAETNERENLTRQLGKLLRVTWRIVNASTGLTAVTAGYGWFTIVVPIIVASPGYFGRELTFGGLMMAVGAFNQVQQSLRWYVDNFGTIADWRATLLRIASFDFALMKVDGIAGESRQIEVKQGSTDRLVFDDVAIAAPFGCVRLVETQVAIAAGEHVVVVGEPGRGKTLFFEAIGGLWPWGSGSIELPKPNGVAFVPRRPYFPFGPLRAALAYPSRARDFPDRAYVSMLERLNLGRLAGSLDRSSAWDRELTDDEQQLLAFARLALRRPRWIVIDEALDALDDDSRRLILGLFDGELAGASVINIGRSIAHDQFFTRVLHLVVDPEGPSVALQKVATTTDRGRRRSVRQKVKDIADAG